MNNNLDEISKLYKDIKHYDPHVRQNAVIGFGKHFLDDNARNALKDEEKANIVNVLLQCLEPKEKSIEVKGRTVRTFSQITKFLTENEIIQVFSRIINYLTQKSAEGKDIYVTCIKNIFKATQISSCKMIGKVICPVLTEGILKSNDQEILELCLDTYTDYIKTFDNVLIKDNDIIKNRIDLFKKSVGFLTSNDTTLQNNAINFIGNLAVLLNKKETDEITKNLIEKLKKSQNLYEKTAILDCLNSIAKTSANKQIELLPELISIINSNCNLKYLEEDSADYDEKNKYIKSCLDCLETYILKLLNRIDKKVLNVIINNCLKLVEYDPNYSYDNQGDNMDVDYDNEYADYEIDAGDMDDSSWKVRMSSVNIIHSFLKSGYNFDKDLIIKIIKQLVVDLREHEENTKIDIISTLCDYLYSQVESKETDLGLTFKRKSSVNVEYLSEVANNINNILLKELKGSNQNLNSNMLKLLPALASVACNEMIDVFVNLKNIIENVCLTDSNNTIIFFDFLIKLFQANTFCEDYSGIYEMIINYIEKGVNNDFYKIQIVALNACLYLLPILSQDKKGYEKYIKKIYNFILPKFKNDDIDAELKSMLINVMSCILKESGDLFDEKTLIELFNLYLLKTKNDLIRSKIYTNLNKILLKQNKLNLTKAIAQFKDSILEILNSSPISLQYTILIFLETVFKYFPNSFKGSENKFIDILLKLINEENLIPVIYNVFIQMAKLIDEKSLLKILTETSEKLDKLTISENQLNSLYEFSNISSEKLNKKINNIIDPYLDKIKDLNSNKSYFIGILCANCGKEQVFINKGINIINSTKKDSNELKNALVLIGDICENSKQKHIELITTLEKMIGKDNEEINNLISIAIGQIGLNDSSEFIKKICSTTINDYVLISIKEFLILIQEKNKNVSEADLNKLFDYLNQKNNFNSKLNIIINHCGECLGILTAVNQKFLNQFLNGLNSNETNVKIGFYYGLSSLLNQKIKLTNETVQNLIPKILQGIQNNELLIKEYSFNALLNASHYYMNIIKDKYNEFNSLFAVYHKINKNWIEVADFGGGMKIINDKGLNLRKAIFSTIKIFVDNEPNKINVSDTINYLTNGLNDNDDIVTIVFGTIIKVAHLFHSNFVPFVDNLCEQLKIANEKIKIAENKKEFAVNVIRLFNELKVENEIDSNPKFVNIREEMNKFLNDINKK